MKRLVFVTESYQNKVFFRKELESLSREYEVCFIGTSGYEEVDCPIDNVSYYFYSKKVSRIKKIAYLFKYLFNSRCHKEICEIVGKAGHKQTSLLTLFIKSIEYFAYAEDFYMWFRKNNLIDKKEKFIYYTYWCNYYTLSVLLHRKKYPNMINISRLHGFDLYKERFPGGRQPFRNYVNDSLNSLFFVSKNSMNYYLQNYDILESKAVLNRLGTEEFVFYKKEMVKDDAFILVSCSNVIPLKRVEYIVKALANCESNIKWIHFGDGNSMEAVSKLAASMLLSKGNIHYRFMGYKSNEYIKEYYASHEIGAFINVSETEGAPVSIMEAMMARIPIIATNVGEASVMVNGNGILLDSNPSITDICNAIENIACKNREDTEKMREKSYSIWKDLFFTDTNVTYFIDYLDYLWNGK